MYTGVQNICKKFRKNEYLWEELPACDSTLAYSEPRACVLLRVGGLHTGLCTNPTIHWACAYLVFIACLFCVLAIEYRLDRLLHVRTATLALILLRQSFWKLLTLK